MLPCNAHSQRHTCIGAEWDSILVGLTENVVHSDKEVIVFGVDVEYPSHACREVIHSKAHATIQPGKRLVVGTQTSLGPGILTIDAGCAEQTKGDGTIDGQVVLTGEAHGGTDACGAAAFVALVLQMCKLS